MKPGQRLCEWWQRYCAGARWSSRQLYAEAHGADPLPPSRFFALPPDDPGGGAWTAPERLRAPTFINSTGHLSQHDRADWRGVDRRLQYWAALFVEYARQRGVPLYVQCALRNRAAQEAARSRGYSRAAYGRSAHNIGEAVDIVHGLFHWDMTRDEWRLLHVLGLRALDRVNAQLPRDRRLALTWGGDFKSLYDPAHWEITDYRARLRPLPDGEPVRQTPRRILSEARKWNWAAGKV